MTDIAHEPVKTAPKRRFSRATENPLVGAIGRIPLPLGAKLIAGFALIAALLAIGYVLGVVALGRSNSRGEQLLQLQRKAVIFQLVEADGAQLEADIEDRILFSHASTKKFGSADDTAIANDFNRLCADTGFSSNCFGSRSFPRPPTALTELVPAALTTALSRNLYNFEAIGGVYPVAETDGVTPVLRRTRRFATSFLQTLSVDAQAARIRTNALVAANQRSYSDSRDLLLGLGTGSLLLALALGLLLSWSVVAPLRRTESRLDEIAAGSFAGRLEVANRDEIGALAAKVNRMSDELERLYGELETASRHKSDFLATMSHELRTPLNAIIGFSEVLHEQMFGELNERQLAYAKDVLEAGQHLLSLINDVLDLAKIEAGRMDLELSQVVLPDLLRSAVSMHSERADRNGIALGLTTEPAEIGITADERRLRQIVFNLLSNAVKFTPAEGRVDVSAHVQNGNVEIAVADTGPGIAAADLETIFEEFEQTTDGKKAEGTGLGLPLSRKLVELHGGRLWAESAPGEGSTFRFTLPIRQETE